jgi:hypothetical protein
MQPSSRVAVPPAGPARPSGADDAAVGPPADVLAAYRRRLTPEQFAWLTRGIAVVGGVPPDAAPAELEEYGVGAPDDR